MAPRLRLFAAYEVLLAAEVESIVLFNFSAKVCF